MRIALASFVAVALMAYLRPGTPEQTDEPAEPLQLVQLVDQGVPVPAPAPPVIEPAATFAPEYSQGQSGYVPQIVKRLVTKWRTETRQRDVTRYVPQVTTEEYQVRVPYTEEVEEMACVPQRHYRQRHQYSFPQQHISLPAQQFSLPQQQFSLPAQQFSWPAQQYSLPAQQFSLPTQCPPGGCGQQWQPMGFQQQYQPIGDGMQPQFINSGERRGGGDDLHLPRRKARKYHRFTRRINRIIRRPGHHLLGH